MSSSKSSPLTKISREKKAANVKKADALKPSHIKQHANSRKKFDEGCESLKKNKLKYTLINLQIETAKIFGSGLSPSTVYRNPELSALWEALVGKKKPLASRDVSHVNLNKETGRNVDARTFQRFKRWKKDKLIEYLAVAIKELKKIEEIMGEQSSVIMKLYEKIPDSKK